MTSTMEEIQLKDIKKVDELIKELKKDKNPKKMIELIDSFRLFNERRYYDKDGISSQFDKEFFELIKEFKKNSNIKESLNKLINSIKKILGDNKKNNKLIEIMRPKCLLKEINKILGEDE